MNEILCGMEIKVQYKGLHLKRQCGVACKDHIALAQHVAEEHAEEDMAAQAASMENERYAPWLRLS